MAGFNLVYFEHFVEIVVWIFLFLGMFVSLCPQNNKKGKNDDFNYTQLR